MGAEGGGAALATGAAFLAAGAFCWMTSTSGSPSAGSAASCPIAAAEVNPQAPATRAACRNTDTFIAILPFRQTTYGNAPRMYSATRHFFVESSNVGERHKGQ